MKRSRKPRVAMVSLGCAKNLVDSEIILGSAIEKGFDVTNDTTLADIVVINTCAFIGDAKEESIDAILSAAQFPQQKLVVAGCLPQRYRAELATEIPEIDAFLSLDDVANAGKLFHNLLSSTDGKSCSIHLRVPPSRYLPDHDTPHFRLTPPHTAYVKIAEGCNHPCSFCIIPQIRGRHRSRTIESVVAEVRGLVKAGVREINLISQDTTFYGMDLWTSRANVRQPVVRGHGPNIADLLDALGEIEGDFWIRLLYTHPAHWGDALIESIARNPRVVPYVDIPLQHIHPAMLQAMKRETSRKHIEEWLRKIRAGIPDVAIRTTFIVGFPGETQEHFESLLDFIEETRFDRLGVFKYSREENSRAAALPAQVPERTKNARLRRAMALQQRIASELAAARIGQTLRVLTETPLTARSAYDAPDVDGRVLLSSEAPVGKFLNARITGTKLYDLIGEVAV